MTTSLDTQLAASVRAVLADLGVNATLLFYTDSYDPVTGECTRAPSSTAVKTSPPAFEELAGAPTETLVTYTDLYPSGAGAEPNNVVDSTLVVNGRNYTVTKCTAYYSGDAIALFRLELKW